MGSALTTITTVLLYLVQSYFYLNFYIYRMSIFQYNGGSVLAMAGKGNFPEYKPVYNIRYIEYQF